MLRIFSIMQSDWTPLHLAAARGRVHVIKFLLENNASINARDAVSVHAYVCLCISIFKSSYKYAMTRKQALLSDLMFNIMYRCYTDDQYNSDMIFTQLLYYATPTLGLFI